MVRVILCKRVLREALCAILAAGLTVGPLGCIRLAGPDDLGGPGGSGDPKSATGLFINTDYSSQVLAGGRGASGETLFVFGTRTASGTVREIEALSVRTADGQEAFISFESGRPVHVQGLDGSYAHVTYSEVSSQRLAGTVELFDAQSGALESRFVEIDLRRAAEDIARQVSQVTGKELQAASLRSGALLAKADGLAQVSVSFDLGLTAGLIFASIGAAIQLTVIALGQVLTAVFTVIGTLIRSVLLVIFYPLYAIAGLFSETSRSPRQADLSITFGFIPLLPIVTRR